jgi:hypothetical protein
MALSNDLATQFAKIMKATKETDKESTAYGQIVVRDGIEYVKLDGSELLTPISTTTVVKDGDRVIVSIKNHTATVTGDLTNPSASNKDVTDMGNTIKEFEILIGNKVTVEQLEAEIARIEQLRADELEATNAKIETIEGKVAKIDTIEAGFVEVSGKVTAQEAEFTTLKSDIATFKDITTQEIDAIEGNFHTLESDYADFEETVTNKLTAQDASIGKIQAETMNVTTADLRYAQIDFSNIGEAAIQKLFTDSGIIKDLVMSDGKVTGELVGVTIKGDLIEGNTVKADKLVILGEDGIYYKLNVNALGETTASSDEKYQTGLDGSVILAESITAEKINVDDLVAFGADIGGFHINQNGLYSGVKESIDNTTEGVHLSADGQMNIGDGNNYVKYYKDEDGNYHLDLSFQAMRDIEEDGTNINNRVTVSLDAIGGLAASVEETVTKQATLDSSVEDLTNDVTEITKSLNAKVTADEVSLIFQKELAETGANKITTATGYVFNENGLNISEGDMSNIVDKTGVHVSRGGNSIFVADADGVKARNLHATTFLIIGETSRFEDFEENGEKRTGCFWIGG